ncbi:UDP-2,4-diacetamido-2,4,6-trideoxy-beta-L-altropyranose hydrolase [Vibrio cincinnatiensis]
MNIIFRVDASLMIGSGHVMRCLVLADELKLKGHDIAFACTPLEGDMRSFISERGFRVITLPAPKVIIISTHDADYESWLQKDVDVDAQDFLSSVSSADLVITDHYAIGEQWQERVKIALGCYLFAIDDLARRHFADLILDQTLGREATDYADSKAIVLYGTEFALLKPAFAGMRERALSRTLPSDKPKVLISMGGVDTPNATLKVLKALADGQVEAQFTVLLSPRAPYFQQVKDWCALRENVTHHEFVTDMAHLMLEHDLAIGAPGTTSWERACLGLPSIVIPLAQNQQLICTQLVEHKAAYDVDIEDISARMVGEYQKSLKHWSEIKDANFALCDGLGTRRVVLEIETLLGEGREDIRLVRASQDDIALVYQWQCHSETRKYALIPHTPTWDEHHRWMSKKLLSVTDHYYIVVDRASLSKVGVVRLDRLHAGYYLISIFVDPQSYGKGFAYKALCAIDAIHPDVMIQATVLQANVASQRLFKKAGYQQVDEETYIRQPIQLRQK